MKVLKVLIVMLILIMSVGAVCAAESITDDAICDDSKEILQTVQEDITTDDSTELSLLRIILSLTVTATQLTGKTSQEYSPLLEII